jgi:pilus assembly protein Flp/PilA
VFIKPVAVFAMYQSPPSLSIRGLDGQEYGRTLMNLFRRLLKDESGATAIEYGLIAAGISVAIIAVVNGLGTKLKATFTSVTSQLN